jgi:pyruvate kinase
VATLGPATSDEGSIGALVEAGVDVVRLNLAHGRADDHVRVARIARERAGEAGRIVGVLADLPGPKMRSGPIKGGSVALRRGTAFTLAAEDVEGDERRASTSVDDLAGKVSEGDSIHLADGEIVLEVESIEDGDVRTRVVRGGVLRTRKGMHLPNAEWAFAAFTDEDRAALEVARRAEVDLVGLSFVRDADDLRRARAALANDARKPLLVAKIETRSGVEHIVDIVEEADVVMVARGDLGIHTPLHSVPLVQKDVIATCNRSGVPVITATEMLGSMTHAPLPTRAEVADVANAVLDGTDALMLSEETAVGERPAEAVATMSSIAACAQGRLGAPRDPSPGAADDPVSWAVARAAVAAAQDLEVAAILCPTRTGATPRRVSSFRPAMPIVGVSGNEVALGGLAAVWGVVGVHVPEMRAARDPAEEVARAASVCKRAGVIGAGDLVIVVAGTPGPRAGRTDYVRIVRV